MLVAFGFLGPRKTDLNYRPGNTIIPPLIKRYPAAGQLCYLGGSFMLPRRVNDIVLAGMRKSTCDLGKNESGTPSFILPFSILQLQSMPNRGLFDNRYISVKHQIFKIS